MEWLKVVTNLQDFCQFKLRLESKSKLLLVVSDIEKLSAMNGNFTEENQERV